MRKLISCSLLVSDSCIFHSHCFESCDREQSIPSFYCLSQRSKRRAVPQVRLGRPVWSPVLRGHAAITVDSCSKVVIKAGALRDTYGNGSRLCEHHAKGPIVLRDQPDLSWALVWLPPRTRTPSNHYFILNCEGTQAERRPRGGREEAEAGRGLWLGWDCMRSAPGSAPGA